MPEYEIPQATGARSQILISRENQWGNTHISADWKYLNVVPGETLDQNLSIYRSAVINRKRSRNKSQRGSQKPGGSIPFELAPMGVSQLMFYALGKHVSTSGSGPYTHTLKRMVDELSLPSFTVEKGFNDLSTPLFCGIKGCRIGGFSLNFAPDAIPTGAFDVMGREFYHGSTSEANGETVDDLTSDPFTSVHATVYEGSSLVPLTNSLSGSLALSNGLYGDNIALGSNYRANLKPGTCEINFQLRAMFNNYDLFNTAVNGTDTTVEIVISNGTYSFVFTFPNAELFPQGSTPKISTDGPLEVNLTGEAVYDTVQDTDCKLVIVSPESTIIT